MLPRNGIGRKSKGLIWSRCNQAADFPLLQSWIVSQASSCAGNQYFQKFWFNPWHKNTPLSPCQKHKKYRQFILLKHRNLLLGKAIPTTMILCMPKVGFSFKSVVLVVKSKPKLSDCSGELKEKCVEFLFFTAYVVWVTHSIICWEVA